MSAASRDRDLKQSHSMRTKSQQIAIINHNYVLIRQQPPLRRTVFSEATGPGSRSRTRQRLGVAAQGPAMTAAPDHLATALCFAARAKRARDEGEWARLLAVAAKYRERAIAGRWRS
jgi:hypothetical protein